MKMKKRFKGLIAVWTAAAMIIAMMLPMAAAETYTVTMANIAPDGYVQYDNPTFSSSNTSLNVPAGVTIEISAGDRQGYLFKEWTDSVGSGHTYNDPTDRCTGVSGLSESCTFTASWTPITYTAALHANYGPSDTTMSTYTWTYDEAAHAALSNPGFTREGYTLIGWSKHQNPTVSDVHFNVNSVPTTNALYEVPDLYAVWAPNTYNITVVDAGENIPYANPVSGTTGSIFTVYHGTKPYHTFKEWTMSGDTTLSSTSSPNGTFVVQAENMTVTANWTENTYHILWNGTAPGTTLKNSVTPFAATKLSDVMPAVTAPAGKYFAGWSAAQNSQTVQYTTDTPISALTFDAAFELELYPVFLSMPVYTVTMLEQIGSNPAAAAPASYTHTGDFYKGGTVTLTAPEKPGYSFVGWYNDSTQISANRTATFTMSDADVTLTAKWQPSDYYFSYNFTRFSQIEDVSRGIVSSPVTIEADRTFWIEFTWKNGIAGADFLGWSLENDGTAEYPVTNVPGQPQVTTVTYKDIIEDVIRANADPYDIVLYGVWAPRTFNIRVQDVGTLEHSHTNPTTGVFDSKITLYPGTKDYYVFDRWSCRQTTISGSSFTMPANNVEATALWSAINYRIIFHPNGAQETLKFVDFNDRTYPLATTTLADVTPALTNPGKYLAGWATSENGPVVYHPSDYLDWLDLNVAAYDVIDLYAVWSNKPVYNVTMYENLGGSNAAAPNTYQQSGTYYEGGTVTLSAPAKFGYTFDGWYNGSTKISGDRTATFTMGSGDVSATAKWTPTEYTLVFKQGTTVLDSSKKFTVETMDYRISTLDIDAHAHLVIDDDQYFDGWLWGDDGDKVTSLHALIKHMTDIGYSSSEVVLQAMLSDHHLVTITFNTNGHGGSIVQSVIQDTTFRNVELPEITANGYRFLGWSLTPGGEVVHDSHAFTGATTLYALWEPIEEEKGFSLSMFLLKIFDIQLILDEETAITAKVRYGDKLAMPEEPVREGFTFTGWYVDEACTELFDFDTTFRTSVLREIRALYAGWEAIDAPTEIVDDVLGTTDDEK